MCVISQYQDYKESDRRKRSFQVRILLCLMTILNAHKATQEKKGLMFVTLELNSVSI